MGGLGGKVAIIGTRTIKFGEYFHQSLSDMIFEAVNLPIPVTCVAAVLREGHRGRAQRRAGGGLGRVRPGLSSGSREDA